MSVFTIWWSIHQKHSYEKQFGNIGSTLRLLTATVAPQLLQAVNDNLESALKADPTQQDKVSQAFAKVENDTSNLRKLKAKLPSSTVEKSAKLLEKAVTLDPDNPYAWRAASQLISYHSELIGQVETNRPDCYKTEGPGDWDKKKTVRYHDCTLNLDDVGGLYAVAPRLVFRGMNFFGGVRYKLIIELTNATVRYSGGPVIEIEQLVCRNCSFEFGSPKEVPPLSGQAISKQLLTADLKNFSWSPSNPQG